MSATACQILANQAKNGAGLYVRNGSLALNGGLVAQNVATGIDALIPIGDIELSDRDGINFITEWTGGVDVGGGVVCSRSWALIENVIFQDNRAEGRQGTGGAISLYGGGEVQHLIRNCLLTGNSAAAAGGTPRPRCRGGYAVHPTVDRRK